MHVQSNGGWLGVWLGGRLGGCNSKWISMFCVLGLYGRFRRQGNLEYEAS